MASTRVARRPSALCIAKMLVGGAGLTERCGDDGVVVVGDAIGCVVVGCTGGAIGAAAEAVSALGVLTPPAMRATAVSIDAMIDSAPLTNPSMMFWMEVTTGGEGGGVIGMVMALAVLVLSAKEMSMTDRQNRFRNASLNWPPHGNFMPVIMPYNPSDYFTDGDGEVCITGGYFCPDS